MAQAAGSLRFASGRAQQPARIKTADKLRRANPIHAWLNSDTTKDFFARRLLGVYQTVLRSPVWLNS